MNCGLNVSRILKLLVIPMLIFMFTAISAELSAGATDTVRDEFNAVSYGGNDGTQNWTNDWQEQNESDGPTAGYLQVYCCTYCSSSNCMYIDAKGSVGINLSREADLSAVVSATLTFSYRRYRGGSNTDGRVALEVFDGSGWTTLQTYIISTTDGSDVPQSFDISSYTASNTQIRFRISVTGGGAGTRHELYVDNVQIEYVPVILSVSVSDSTFTFGTQPANGWTGSQSASIINDGTVAENFMGSISQFTDGANTWEISASANGADTIRAQWSTVSDAGPWTDISAYDTDFTIATNLAVSDSVIFRFRIQTPIGTSSHNEHSSTLTVTAQEY
jgi:hypothetical protein